VESLDGVSLQGKDSHGCYFDQILFFPLPCAFSVRESCAKLMVISGEESSLMWCNRAKRVGFASVSYAMLGVSAGSIDEIGW
jgi:hypothetical protein